MRSRFGGRIRMHYVRRAAILFPAKRYAVSWTSMSERIIRRAVEKGGSRDRSQEVCEIILDGRANVRANAPDVMHRCKRKDRKSRFFFEAFFSGKVGAIGSFSPVEGDDKAEWLCAGGSEFFDCFELRPAGCDHIIDDRYVIAGIEHAEESAGIAVRLRLFAVADGS